MTINIITTRVINIVRCLGNLSGMTYSINKIGMIYSAQGKNLEALKMLDKALENYIRLGLEQSPNAENIKREIKKLEN